MFTVEWYGSTYHLYEGDKEFGERINKSPETLSKMTSHPARLKDKGRVLWCLEIWTMNLLEDRLRASFPDLYPQPEKSKSSGKFPEAKDFERKHLEVVK